jgi:hypothetical protein
MKTYSVYLTYLTCSRNGRYRNGSISYKDIQANDSSSAIEIAFNRASSVVKNNVTPIQVSMFWSNIA